MKITTATNKNLSYTVFVVVTVMIYSLTKHLSSCYTIELPMSCKYKHSFVVKSPMPCQAIGAELALLFNYSYRADVFSPAHGEFDSTSLYVD